MLLLSDVFPLYPKGCNLPSTCRKNHWICFPNTFCCCSFFKPRVELHKRFFRHETALVKHGRFVINSHGRDFVFSHHLRNSQTKTPDHSYLQKLFTWSSPRNDWQRSHQLQIRVLAGKPSTLKLAWQRSVTCKILPGLRAFWSAGWKLRLYLRGVRRAEKVPFRPQLMLAVCFGTMRKTFFHLPLVQPTGAVSRLWGL